jgi:hypothetical protein
MSVGNTVNITQLGLFPGPFITKNPEGLFTNVNLNNGVGTYTVYKIFQSNTNPSGNYKMYVVTVNLTNMNAGQSSVSNALPSPYIATRGFTYHICRSEARWHSTRGSRGLPCPHVCHVS